MSRFPGLTAVSVTVVLCVLFVDRPLALWVNERVHGSTAFVVGATILRPLNGLGTAGAVLLGLALVWRRRFVALPWMNRSVVAGICAVVALAGALVLKLAIGRSQLYPLFLLNHIYEVRPFAGSENFTAFPSATMAGLSAFVAGVGGTRGFQRAASAAILVIVAVALVVTSSHWLSDIIGGTYLGVAGGAEVAMRLRRRWPLNGTVR